MNQEEILKKLEYISMTLRHKRNDKLTKVDRLIEEGRNEAAQWSMGFASSCLDIEIKINDLINSIKQNV